MLYTACKLLFECCDQIINTPHNFILLPPVVLVEFNPTYYTVNEGDPRIQVCAQLNRECSECLVAFPFEVEIETVDDTAGIVHGWLTLSGNTL